MEVYTHLIQEKTYFLLTDLLYKDLLIVPNVSFGKASLTYKLPDYAAKKYNITVVYGENNKYVSAKQNTTLTLQKLNTKTTFTTKTINDTLRINVKTIDEHNKTVNTGKIAVKLNGKTIGLYNNTDSVDYKIPQSWTNKNVTVLVIYGENSVYNTSRHQEKITIKQNNLKNKQSSMKKYDIIVNYYVSSTGDVYKRQTIHCIRIIFP